MNKIIKAITIVIVIIVILVILLFSLGSMNGENININSDINEEEDMVGTKSIERVTSRDDFYIIENCIQKYIGYVKEKDVEKIYGCLDEEFLEKENITKENIASKIENWETENFIAEKMYVYDDTETISEYFVEGVIEGEKYYIIVKVDYENETFSVMPNYYIDENYMENQGTIRIVKIEN